MQQRQERILREYERLQSYMDRDTALLRESLGRFPCAVRCYDCCRNTATLLLSRVEALDIQRGLAALPPEVRRYIGRKAARTVRRLESLGYRWPDESPLSTQMIEGIRGTAEAECPLLIAGICMVYDHRPVICRLWGYPMISNGSVTCCYKTFIGQRNIGKPVDFDHYWRATRELSAALGESERTPNCYVVLELVRELENQAPDLDSENVSSEEG